MILHHITPLCNVDSILRNGLIPAHSTGINRSRTSISVFLTNDVNKIIETQSGKEWCEQFNSIVLEIDVSNLIIKPHEYNAFVPAIISDYEFICEYVPPENIKIKIDTK